MHPKVGGHYGLGEEVQRGAVLARRLGCVGFVGLGLGWFLGGFGEI